MLRAFLVGIGVLLIAGGLLTLHSWGSFAWPVTVELLFGGVLLLVAIFGEARRYGVRKASSGPWEATGERFTDPTTGKLMEVRYNSQTGQRDYEEVR